MRIRTALAVGLLAAPLSVLTAPPAGATPPHTGCAVGWDLGPYPPELAFIFAVADKNNDGFLCTKNSANGERLHDNTAAATPGTQSWL
ncbi:MAG: hypothetical protein JWO22_1099 [Frankiales bacterium]|nr:hypothetical protein [Frankiales bacterium]